MKDIGITISFLISGLFGAILMASKDTETSIRVYHIVYIWWYGCG
jgi:hypothetical protein